MSRTLRRPKERTTIPPAFEAWLLDVDRICRTRLSLSLQDLPDMLTRDAFEEGVSPEEFFHDTVVPTVREDFGSIADEALAATAQKASRELGADRGLDDFDDLGDDEFACIAFEDA